MQSTKLKELRKSRGMTLDELAEIVGTSKQTIHRDENGIINNVPPEKVVSLASALGTTPSELMGWDEEPAISYPNVMPVNIKHLPVLGNIACGMPIYAEQQNETFVAVSDKLDADFCLKATGDSMVGARIFDGDIVFIRSQSFVENGEIAAVIINDEATLKRVYYYPNEGKLVLSPENPKYPPLVYVKNELDSIKIIGKAIAFQSTII